MIEIEEREEADVKQPEKKDESARHRKRELSAKVLGRLKDAESKKTDDDSDTDKDGKKKGPGKEQQARLQALAEKRAEPKKKKRSGMPLAGIAGKT